MYIYFLRQFSDAKPVMLHINIPGSYIPGIAVVWCEIVGLRGQLSLLLLLFLLTSDNYYYYACLPTIQRRCHSNINRIAFRKSAAFLIYIRFSGSRFPISIPHIISSQLYTMSYSSSTFHPQVIGILSQRRPPTVSNWLQLVMTTSGRLALFCFAPAIEYTPDQYSTKGILRSIIIILFAIRQCVQCCSKQLLLRGTMVNRAYGVRKNLPGIYLPIFLVTLFGPIYYGPP